MKSAPVAVRFRAEDRSVLEAIAALRQLEGCALRLLGHKLIVDRYFDTAEWHLLAQGCTYRERMLDRRRWVAFRGPVEKFAIPPDPIEVELPDCTRLDDVETLLPPMFRAWAVAGYRSLGQILLTENNRTLIEVVEQGEPRFLLCLDDAEFLSNGPSRRCCAVKLHVRRDPNGLMRWLAASLRRDFGLIEMNVGKLQAGLALTEAGPATGFARSNLPDIHAAFRSVSAS